MSSSDDDTNLTCARCLKFSESGHWCQPLKQKIIYCCDECCQSEPCHLCQKAACTRCALHCACCKKQLCSRCKFIVYDLVYCKDLRHATRCSVCQSTLN